MLHAERKYNAVLSGSALVRQISQWAAFCGTFLYLSCYVGRGMKSGGPFVPSALGQAAGIPDAVSTGSQLHAGHFSTCKHLLGNKDEERGPVLLWCCPAATSPRSTHLAPRTAGTETKHATAHLYLSMELMCTVYCVCQDRLQNGALEKLTCRWEVPGQLPIFPSPDKRYTSLRKSRKDP